MARILISMVTVLMATAAGLCAETWQNYTAENTEGMPGNEVQFLAPAKDGGVWVGTLSGVAKFRNGKFEPVNDAQGKPLKIEAWCLLETAAGIWIGHGNGVQLIGDDSGNALKGHTVAPIIEVAPGVLWALAKDRRTEGNQLLAFAGGEWQPVPGSEELRLVDLYRDQAGRLWLSLDGDGILQIDVAAGLAKAVHHLRGFNVTTVAEDNRGGIWCGLWGRGVAIFDGTEWQRALTDQKDAAILSIAQDGKGNFWVATSASGLWMRPFNKQTWGNYLAADGAINLLATGGPGLVWVSSQMAGGLRRWDGETWQPSLESPLPMRCFAEVDGCYYAGGVLDGLHVQQP